jgi:myo-inositol catabolism protein IolS
MELRNCGTSDLKLSALGLGCWEFGGGEYWGESDQDNVSRIVHRAIDLGITYFDTAELYNGGRSEEFLGKAMQGVPRDRVVVGSKIWPTNLRPKTLAEHCEASLKRLGMDYVDVYMIHWPWNPEAFGSLANTGLSSGDQKANQEPFFLEDTVDILLRLQEQGKIRHLGLSNHGVTRFKEIQSIGGKYVVNQLVYNLLTRAAEMEILPYCRQVGTDVIAYMVLMQGLLTDKYSNFDEIPDWYVRTRHFDCKRTERCRHGEKGAEAETIQALQGIRAIARECGVTIADIALKWAVAAKGITCALVGTQNLKRLEANVKAVEEPLPDEIIKRLNTLTQALKDKLGPGLDIFESIENDRTR